MVVGGQVADGTELRLRVGSQCYYIQRYFSDISLRVETLKTVVVLNAAVRSEVVRSEVVG